MIRIRIMLSDGENEFRKYINDLRRGLPSVYPDLNDSIYSKDFDFDIYIEEGKKFKSKLELAQYLVGLFASKNLRREDVIGNNGLWTWLAYIWFDQLSTRVDTGKRIIREDERYVCSSDYRNYYRHLIAGPYNIFSLHGRDNSLLFLYSPVNEHNDFIEQVASRQFMISYNNLIETLSRLYLDREKMRPKKGAQSRKKGGSLRRFINFIQQLQLTYDIYSMSSEKIIEHLPEEYDEWK